MLDSDEGWGGDMDTPKDLFFWLGEDGDMSEYSEKEFFQRVNDLKGDAVEDEPS